jgi:hypothetical protein
MTATEKHGMYEHHDEEMAPELAELHLPDKPDGPAAAAMIAAGFGIFVLGLLTTLAEISEATREFLASFEMGRSVGPLAGKTTLAVAAWLAGWVVLHWAWRKQDVALSTAFWVGLALGIVGAIGTFPPFFEAFAG